MKDCFISLILFSILMAFMIGSSLYIKKEANDLKDAVTNIPPINSAECQSLITSLRNKWIDFKKIARFSLNYSELNKMECLIEELECHRATGNSNDFEHTKVMMINLLREFIRYEKISIDGIM